MNKTELAAELARRTNVSQSDVGNVLDALFDATGGVITSELRNGGEVSIGGFGKFEARKREARQGRNPATGESIQIAAKTSPAFKAAKNFKDAL